MFLFLATTIASSQQPTAESRPHMSYGHVLVLVRQLPPSPFSPRHIYSVFTLLPRSHATHAQCQWLTCTAVAVAVAVTIPPADVPDAPNPPS